MKIVLIQLKMNSNIAIEKEQIKNLTKSNKY